MLEQGEVHVQEVAANGLQKLGAGLQQVLWLGAGLEYVPRLGAGLE